MVPTLGPVPLEFTGGRAGRRPPRRGRDVIDAEWHAELATWSGTYLADPEKMRGMTALAGCLTY